MFEGLGLSSLSSSRTLSERERSSNKLDDKCASQPKFSGFACKRIVETFEGKYDMVL